MLHSVAFALAHLMRLRWQRRRLPRRRQLLRLLWLLSRGLRLLLLARQLLAFQLLAVLLWHGKASRFAGIGGPSAMSQAAPLTG